MSFSFPTNPILYQRSTQNGRTYFWTGSAWEIVSIETAPTSPIWERPTEWLSLPNISSTNNRFVGLLRIDAESNFVALRCTVTGGYTVDWGDGTVTNHTSAVNAEKQYNYSSVPNTGESTLGYRQVIITVYPQTPEQNITAFSLQQRHSQSGLGNYRTPWLDIAINASAMTSLAIGGSVVSPLSYLQRATIYNHSLTSTTSLFNTCTALASVPLFNTSTVTNMSNMFNGCRSLTTVPLFNTVAVTDMSGMFLNCTSLTDVPLFNTASVTAMNSMFNACSSLTDVPLFNTSAVTNMTSMFANCTVLTTVPLFNTASVTNMNSMFTTCPNLITVPLFNTASVTNMGLMFNNCFNLITIPSFNTSAVTAGNFTNIFVGCANLSSAPFAGTNQNISYLNCKLSASSLNAIYSGLSINGAGKTITVTGNWGTATDNPSMATSKGWTVIV